MSAQEMLDVAMRHCTSMSDAMIDACVRWAYETGERLSVPQDLAERRLNRDETREIPYEDFVRLTGGSVA